MNDFTILLRASTTRRRIWQTTLPKGNSSSGSGVVAVVILLIFLYFYRPFETYLVAHIPFIHFSNVVFWFASLVGIVAYAFAHWQSFRTEIFRNVSELNVDNAGIRHPAGGDPGDR